MEWTRPREDRYWSEPANIQLNRELADRIRRVRTTLNEDVLRCLSGPTEKKGLGPVPRTGVLASLYPGYLAQIQEGDRAAMSLDLCASAIDWHLASMSVHSRFGLYGGWAGFGWLTAHLEAEDDFVGQHVEQLLTAGVQDWPPQQGYDLISGLVGAGVFFLERLPTEGAARGLSLVLDALAASADCVEGGTSWFTAPEFLPVWQRKRAPKGYFNLGVAHGVPGVCWFLGQLCAAGIEEDRAASLLLPALRWVRSHQPDPTNAELPSWIAIGVDPEPNRRMSWCYGPLGASMAIRKAALAVGDSETTEWAMTLAVSCAQVSPQASGIRDAGLCHGAAGNAQMFRRLYSDTGYETFYVAFEEWLRATVDHHRPGEGVGGYSMWGEIGEQRQGWMLDNSFLSGSAGVALVLLCAATDIVPKWDRLLLLS